MIRVIFITTGLSTGGAETMLYKLLVGLDRARFEPTVISLMNKDTQNGRLIEELGVHVHSLGISRGKISLSAMWRLICLVRSLQPDIIQGWMYHGNLAASLSGLFSNIKIPVLWNIHHTAYDLKDEKKKTALIIRLGLFFARWTAGNIYVSREGAARHEALGYPTKSSIVIPNGIDCNEFKPSILARADMRQSLGVSEKDVLIGLFARHHPVKDHANFFNAAGILIRKYNNVQFVLAGLDVDVFNKAISKLILQHRLFGRVHLLGFRNDVPELTAGLDIASSTSFSEAFPLALGEAMACGIPCVATDVGDSAWIIGDTGKIVPPRNAKALAEAWELLIEAGAKERKKLGEKARKRVLENFTLEQVVQKYETLYENVNNNTLVKN